MQAETALLCPGSSEARTQMLKCTRLSDSVPSRDRWPAAHAQGRHLQTEVDKELVRFELCAG